MPSQPDPPPAAASLEARFRAALELRELGIAMRRQVLAREHPDEGPDQIQARLRRWVLDHGLPRPRARRSSGTAGAGS